MKWRLVLTCLSVLLLSGCVSPVDIANSTVWVNGVGSGTVVRVERIGDIDQVCILTAAHVLRPPLAEVTFMFRDPRWGLMYDMRSMTGYIAVHDTMTDVGIIVVPLERGLAHARKVARMPPRLGERLIVSGYPKGTYMLTQGTCSGYSYGKFITTADVDGGSSGGGVYNSRMELVGVMTNIGPAMSGKFSPIFRADVEDYIRNR